MHQAKITHYRIDDPAVWPLVGPLLTSRAVAKELGGQPFTDGVTDYWIATERGKIVGFCALADVQGAYWELYSYVLPDRRGKGIHLSLCAARTRYVATLPEQPLKVCCRKARWKKHYVGRGFQVASERGDWVYGVREPKKSEQKEAAK